MYQSRIPVRPSPWISFPSRRDLLRGLTSVGLALPIARPPDSAAKKKRKRRNKRKIKRNAFGCVNVGSHCKSIDQCCSGICQGKQGKKKCQAHDQSTCQAGQQQDLCGGQTILCRSALGSEGTCDTTTGNAGYCVADGDCTVCTKDADCFALCGPQAACIVCAGCEEEFVNITTACVGPEPDSCGPVMA